MNTDDIAKIGLNIIAPLGTVSLIIFALSSWLGKVWANRIFESEKSKISQELEVLKTNNQNYINSISLSNSLYLDAQKVYATERILAIKSLWSDLMDLRDNRPSCITFLDILLFNEYKQIYQNHEMDFFDEELAVENFAKIIKKDTEKLRPFVDEQSYTYFWAYRALIGRLASYIRKIRKDGAPKESWHFEKGVTEVLGIIINKSKIKEIQSNRWTTIELFDYIEALFVEHLRELSSGSELSKNSIDHSINLTKAAKAIKDIKNSEIPK